MKHICSAALKDVRELFLDSMHLEDVEKLRLELDMAKAAHASSLLALQNKQQECSKQQQIIEVGLLLEWKVSLLSACLWTLVYRCWLAGAEVAV